MKNIQKIEAGKYWYRGFYIEKTKQGWTFYSDRYVDTAQRKKPFCKTKAITEKMVDAYIRLNRLDKWSLGLSVG